MIRHFKKNIFINIIYSINFNFIINNHITCTGCSYNRVYK